MQNLIKRLKTLCRGILNRMRPLSGIPTVHHRVNVEYWYERDCPNLGDLLSPVVVDWVAKQRGLDPEKVVAKTRHLYAIGSVLGNNCRRLHATVWGSGVLNITAIRELNQARHRVRLDVRAVRGPITRQVLLTTGYACPAVYGDPAVLLPLLYTPPVCKEKIPVLLIRHWQWAGQPSSLPTLDIRTGDYKSFVDRLSRAKKVISSSLHGVILAEAYGIPAVFLNQGMLEDFQLIKVYDWYYATGRTSVPIAHSVEQALELEPLPVPDLTKMQRELMEAFPFDLWE